MKNIAFVITNPNHHWDMVRPVIDEIQIRDRVSIKLLSFCELRRMVSPQDEWEKRDLNFVVIPKAKFLTGNPSMGRKSLGGSISLRRRTIHWTIWHLFLRRSLINAIQNIDELVLLNDKAFPGYQISRIAKSKGIKISLIQEGIRFDVPTDNNKRIYGLFADRIFTWGNRSSALFRNRFSKKKILKLFLPDAQN